MVSRAPRGAAGCGGISDHELRRFPGGAAALAARQAAARLLELLPSLHPQGAGPIDGWQDVSRRGRLEHLLLSEHLQDEDEFLRRHLDGEQLFLARQGARRGAAPGILCWELTPPSLGASRLAGLGVALALQRRLAEEGAPLRTIINAAGAFDLASGDELRAILALPPRCEPVEAEAWKDAVWSALRPQEAAEVYWLTAEPEPPAPADPAGRALLGLAADRPPPLFLVEPRRLSLYLAERGPRGAWRQVGRVALAAGAGPCAVEDP